MGENEMTGTQQIASMPADITSSFLGKAIPTVASSGTGALNTAASLNTTTDTTPSFWSYFMQGLQGIIAGRRRRRIGAYAAGGIMGGALGFALGTALNAAGGFAKAKVEKERQHDDFLLSTYQQHPEMASTPDAQTVSQQEIRPGRGRHVHAGRTGRATFGKDLQGPIPPLPPVVHPPRPRRGYYRSKATRCRRTSPILDADASSIINRLQAKVRQCIDEASRIIVAGAYRGQLQQRNQFNWNHSWRTKQQEGFAQQEKLLTERGEQSDKKMQEMFEQQDKRLAQSEAFQNDMQGRREQQQNHLQDLKDAKTAQDRTLKMKQIIASLGKTTADLTAKLGKGSDYSQLQREMSAESHNQYIQGLMTMTDDPDQVAALKRNLIKVGAEGAGYLGTSVGAKAGAVGAEGDDTTTTSYPEGTTAKTKDGKPVVWKDGGWHPAT